MLRILLVAVASSLGVAAIDVGASIYPWSDHWRTPGAVLRVTPIVLGVAFVTLLVVGILVTGISRRRQWNVPRAVDAWGLASLAGFAAMRIIDRTFLRNETEIAIVAALLAAAAASLLTYRRPPSAVKLSLSGLAVAAVTAVTWVAVYPLSEFTWLVQMGWFSAGLVMVVWIWLRCSSRPDRPLALSVAAAFIITLAAGCVAVHSPSAYFQKVNASTIGSPQDAPSILLLSVDTLRRDALSAYHPDAPPTPNLDALLDDSVVFEDAVSSGSWTLPSVASIMTGLTAQEHRMSPRQWRLPQHLPRLAQLLSAHGYRTAAAVDNGWLRAAAGFDQGFQDFSHFPRIAESVGSRTEPIVGMDTTETLTWLASDWMTRTRTKPFFFWLHYYTPHGPYVPPTDLKPPNPAAENLPDSFGNHSYFDDFRRRRRASDTVTPSPEMVAWARSLYDGEVRFVDREIGKLIESLRQAGLYDRLMIVFVADHGEEFGEHGSWSHAFTTYPEVVAVPLAIKPPESSAGRRVDSTVSTRRVYRTILDSAGVAPAECEDSVSLLASPAKGAPKRSLGVATASKTLARSYETALVFPDQKIVHDRESDRVFTYNRNDDPRELHRQEPTTAELPSLEQHLELHRQRTEYRRRCLGLDEQIDTPELDQRAVDKLRELGYIQ